MKKIMNKFFIILAIFSMGYTSHDLLGNIIKPAYAYGCDCDISDFSISS